MTQHWFTSDHHFDHHNIIEYCGRPFKDVDDMNKKLIDNWNKVVKKDDVVFHLGDFSFRGRVNHFKEKLNGHIIHIKGNHDSSKDVKIRKINLSLGGKTWTLVHKPEDSKDKYVICGHVHEKWKTKKENGQNFVNVGVDQWNFKPIKIENVLKALKKRTE